MLQEYGKINQVQNTPVLKLLKWRDYKQAIPHLQINTESLNDLNLSVVTNPFMALSISCYDLIIIIIVSYITRFSNCLDIEFVDLFPQ